MSKSTISTFERREAMTLREQVLRVIRLATSGELAHLDDRQAWRNRAEEHTDAILALLPALPPGWERWQGSRPDMDSYDAMTGEEVSFIYIDGGERIKIRGPSPRVTATAIIEAHNRAMLSARPALSTGPKSDEWWMPGEGEPAPITVRPYSMPALSTESGWRDIATAPKDGTVVDVWARSPGPLTAGPSRICDVWFSIGKWWRHDFEFGDDQCRSEVYRPTHWMPLPAPPWRLSDD